MGRLAGHRIDPFLLAGGKAEEIGHGFRGFVVEQVDFDVTFGGAHDDGSHNPKCLMGLRPGDWIFLWAVTAMPCSSIICVTLALWIQFVPQ